MYSIGHSMTLSATLFAKWYSNSDKSSHIKMKRSKHNTQYGSCTALELKVLIMFTYFVRRLIYAKLNYN